jgi:lambda family phage portal protein
MARRRLKGWNPPLENINALVASGGPRLLARARELVVTNGYAANACEAFAANLVGDGIKPSSLIEDAGLRERVQKLWLAWTDEADADGLTDFYGLQAMVAREMFVAGECFVRLRPRRAEDGLMVPLQLQLLQSEMLPFEKTETAANGNRIRCGIEFDGIGRRVAYHFRRRHPGDSTDQRVAVPDTVRVLAGDVLHIYRPIDAGQIRGLPHVAPAMVRLFLLDQYDDAELDRKKTAAMFAGFITKTAPEEPMMGEAEADLDGAAIASLEPGTMQVLLPGEDVKFSSPADVGGGYEAFQYRTLLAVSASLGLPYHLVTGDVRLANYSSLRAELVEFRRRIGQLQHGVTRMPFASTSLGAEQPLLNSELLGYGRDPLAPIKDAVTADGDIVVPLDAEALGFWLKAAFGNPVTSGVAPGPFTHEFRSGAWTLPSMSIETAMPEVPRFALYSGCVLDQLTWQVQRSGLLTATAKLVAQGETVGTATSAGTPAALNLKRFGHFNATVSRDGAALGNIVSAEITYANSLDRIETIRRDGRIDGADPSIAALTGKIEVRFADQVLVDQALSGDPCELAFAYVLPSGESFSFTVHAVYLPRPRIEISGPQGIQATFDWQAARDATLGRMCTATLVNDVETY